MASLSREAAACAAFRAQVFTNTANNNDNNNNNNNNHKSKNILITAIMITAMTFVTASNTDIDNPNLKFGSLFRFLSFRV